MRRAWTAILSIALFGTMARAQPRPPAPDQPASERAAPEPSGLRTRFGAAAAARMMRSSDADERRRGVERAAAAHTLDALALLQRAAGPGAPAPGEPHASVDGVARSDPRALLFAVRGLSTWIERDGAKAALTAILSAPTQSFATSFRPRSGEAGDVPSRVASEPAHETPDDSDGAARVAMARREAAIALAASGNPSALETLVAIARSGGPGQDAALEALAVHPPARPLLGGVTLTTPSTIALAAKIGDLRSIDAIEGALDTSDPALRAAALTALAGAGDLRALPTARASTGDGDARVRVAAAEALARLGAPDAEKVIAALVADDKTTLPALRLSALLQGAGIVRAAAARAMASADREVRTAAVVALGGQSDPSAAQALGQLARDPILGGDAAEALGRSPSGAACAVLEALATSSPAMRRLAARAYFVRRVVRQDDDARLDALLVRLVASADPLDRAVGVQALVALGERRAQAALMDEDPRVRQAAAMGAMGLLGSAPFPQTSLALIGRLDGESDDATRQVSAIALLDEDAATGVSTSALTGRAEAGGADAPLAVLALARRSDGEGSAKGSAFLASADPLLRAHAAAGLAASPAEDATGRLARAYVGEVVAEVRRAVVNALVERGAKDPLAPSRLETLEWAAELDPDAGVRFAAKCGLEGKRPPSSGPVREVAWIRLVAAEGATLPRQLTGTLVGSDGLARPIVFDEEGYALVPGVPPGPALLRLAPRIESYKGALP